MKLLFKRIDFRRWCSPAISAMAILSLAACSGERQTLEVGTEPETVQTDQAAPVQRQAAAPRQQPTWDGPFGVKAGLTLEDLSAAIRDLEQVDEFTFASERLPRHHAAIALYGLHITPETGLCSISASTDEFSSDSQGLAVRGQFESFVEAIERRYGFEPQLHDFAQAGSIYSRPEHFMMAMERGERTLAARWNFEQGNEHDLLMITVGASALDHRTGRILISYRFANWEACDRIAKDHRNSAL